jgi:hypothetical protein
MKVVPLVLVPWFGWKAWKVHDSVMVGFAAGG